MYKVSDTALNQTYLPRDLNISLILYSVTAEYVRGERQGSFRNKVIIKSN